MKYAPLLHNDENSRHFINDKDKIKYMSLPLSDITTQPVDPDIGEILNTLHESAVVAGSSVMSLIDGTIQYNDIDVFIHNKLYSDWIHKLNRFSLYKDSTIEYVARYSGTLRHEPVENCGQVNDTANLITIKRPNGKRNIQVISTMAETPYEVIHGFDFICAKVAIDSNLDVYAHVNARNHIAERKLAVEVKYGEPSQFIRRTVKYIDKGFKPNSSFYYDAGMAVDNQYVVVDGEIHKKTDSLYHR